MSVERIEEYRQQNGEHVLKVILTPTKTFNNGGYFYAPAEAECLVQRYGWFLFRDYSKNIYVVAHDENHDGIRFHGELFKFYHNCVWNQDIDHVNVVEIDNTDANLNAVSRLQNQYNKFVRGYKFATRDRSFIPTIRLNGRYYYPFNEYRRTEDVACQQQNYINTIWLKEQMGDAYYMFDFKKYRRGSEDILDLERTGKISEEEAIYQHILRYADNAWYMLRYGLEDYYKENHIPIPRYALDANGFMVHPITGQKLCPFN